MQAKLTLVRDLIEPDLVAKLKTVQNKKPIHRAMGIAVVSLSKRAFTQNKLRPHRWKAKKDGSASTLQKSTTLRKSVRVITANRSSVLVGSDRAYAAIHQLGGVSRAMPARPYMPFHATGEPTATARRILREVIRKKLEKKNS